MTRIAVPFNDLRAGDLIRSIDDQPIEPPHMAASDPEGHMIRLVEPEGTATEWWLYREQGERFLIDREVPGIDIPVELDTDRMPDAVRLPEDAVTYLRTMNTMYAGSRLLRDLARTRLHQRLPCRTSNGWHLVPPGSRTSEQRAIPGDIVFIPRWGNWQVGVVVKTGPKLVSVTFVARYGAKFDNPRPYRPSFTQDMVYVVTEERWAQKFVRGYRPETWELGEAR